MKNIDVEAWAEELQNSKLDLIELLNTHLDLLEKYDDLKKKSE